MTRPLAAALLLGLLATAARAEAPPRPIVVELFSSQGCSSCPPADRLLRDLATTRADVLPLAFHVTYWNNLGWHDPYSLDAATKRQRDYQALSDIGGIYTPQAVVDGVQDVVGSDAPRLRRAIAAAAAKATTIPLTATRAGTDVAITLGQGQGAGRILLIGYDPEHKTTVPRGENAGNTLIEANIVRGIAIIGEWRGRPLDLHVPAPAGEALALIVQSPDGRILAAARVAAEGARS